MTRIQCVRACGTHLPTQMACTCIFIAFVPCREECVHICMHVHTATHTHMHLCICCGKTFSARCERERAKRRKHVNSTDLFNQRESRISIRVTLRRARFTMCRVCTVHAHTRPYTFTCVCKCDVQLTTSGTRTHKPRKAARVTDGGKCSGNDGRIVSRAHFAYNAHTRASVRTCFRTHNIRGSIMRVGEV